MIKHIVMWRVRKDDRESHIEAMKDRLEALPPLIPEICDFEVGVNINPSERSLDMVLVSTFNSREDLTTYAAHPAHQDVVAFITSVTELARVVDFEV